MSVFENEGVVNKFRTENAYRQTEGHHPSMYQEMLRKRILKESVRHLFLVIQPDKNNEITRTKEGKRKQQGGFNYRAIDNLQFQLELKRQTLNSHP